VLENSVGVNNAQLSVHCEELTVGTVISHFWKSTGLPRVDHILDTPKLFIEMAFWKKVDALMAT